MGMEYIDQLTTQLAKKFAAACYNDNIIGKLVLEIANHERGEGDEMTQEDWGLTPNQYLMGMYAALKEKLDDEGLRVTEWIEHDQPQSDYGPGWDYQPITYTINDRFILQRGTDGEYSIPSGNDARVLGKSSEDQDDWMESLGPDADWVAEKAGLKDPYS